MRATLMPTRVTGFPVAGITPELSSVPSATSTDIGIRLSFAGAKVNLGDIATGAVKSTIDCLYPILGGAAGAPDDWKVGTLQCEKGARDAPAEGVLIEVWSSGS